MCSNDRERASFDYQRAAACDRLSCVFRYQEFVVGATLEAGNVVKLDRGRFNELWYSYPYSCQKEFYKLHTVPISCTSMFYEPSWSWAWVSVYDSFLLSSCVSLSLLSSLLWLVLSCAWSLSLWSSLALCSWLVWLSCSAFAFSVAALAGLRERSRVRHRQGTVAHRDQGPSYRCHVCRR